MRRHSFTSKDDPSITKWRQHSLSSFSKSEIHVQSEKTNVSRPWIQAFIALGSNLGDRIDWIEQACKQMANLPEIKLVRTSSLWETDPMYVVDQEKFINGVCEVSLEAEYQRP